MNRPNDDRSSKISRIWKSKIFLDSLFWLFLFLTMVFGIVAKAFYDYIENNESFNLGWDILLRREVLLPIFVSPMVFGGIYSIAKQSPRNFGTFIFAFQNGFFWKTILGRGEQEAAFPQ